MYMFVPFYIFVNIVFCPHGPHGLLDFEIKLYLFTRIPDTTDEHILVSWNI